MPCGVPILADACDLGIVRDLPDGCILKLNPFKWKDTVPERVRVDDADRSI
jgi:hypothetical protein